MIDPHSIFLLLSALGAVVGIILLVTVLKLNPFLSLLIASLALAIVARMPMGGVVHSFEVGVGNTLGHIAIVVALGTMLGKMMAESGGADTIALTLIRVFGEKHLPWAMMFIGLIVGLPAFFEVGFVLLIPIAFTVARRTGTPLIKVALPLVAALSVDHGLVPPHPAALLAVNTYHADVGRTILYALLIGIPTATLAGPIFAKIITPWIKVPAENPMADDFEDHTPGRTLPGFWLTIAQHFAPCRAYARRQLGRRFRCGGLIANQTIRFLGNDDMALLIGVLVSFVTLGIMRGVSKETILRFSNECLAPTATITLLVGAGGGFGRVLQDSGVSQAMIQIAMQQPFTVAVACLAAGRAHAARDGIGHRGHDHRGRHCRSHRPANRRDVRPELLAIATGAGSLIFSHVNDGGFWLVKEYFNMSVTETIKTWSVCETIISFAGLGFALLASLAI